LALPQAASLITPTISANQPISTSPLSNDSQHVKVTNHITGSTATVATATGSLTETISADMSTVTATLATVSATDNLTPTRQPTSTAIATSGAGSVKRAKNDTTPTPTRTPTPPTAMLGAVQLDTPADNATLEKEITFRWSLSQRAPPEVSQIFTPTSAYLFELIVFSDPKHPEEGRALVQASKTPSATVNVDLLQNSPWQFIEGREYYWSVRLGKTVNNHYQALALLATPRRFVFRPTTNK
jgi:hypothetical protein